MKPELTQQRQHYALPKGIGRQFRAGITTREFSCTGAVS
jgi:hypothetical protein